MKNSGRGVIASEDAKGYFKLIEHNCSMAYVLFDSLIQIWILILALTERHHSHMNMGLIAMDLVPTTRGIHSSLILQPVPAMYHYWTGRWYTSIRVDHPERDLSTLNLLALQCNASKR
jgi:hypothetical protein